MTLIIRATGSHPTNTAYYHLFVYLLRTCPCTSVYVTKQTGARPCGALILDPTISVEENRFLFTGFQTRWCWEHSSSVLCLSQNPALPLLSKRLSAKTMPRSSPYPHLFLSRLLAQISILFGKCSWCVSELPSTCSSSLLQDTGYIVLSLVVVGQENVCLFSGAAAQLLFAFVMQSILAHHPLPLPLIEVCGEYALLFWGTSALYLLYVYLIVFYI